MAAAPEAFSNRTHAGQVLAGLLDQYRHRGDVLVLGLPRGGVPVAAEVSRALSAPLDVFVVRKLGVPGREELAMGAIATGGVRVLNKEVISRLNIQDGAVAAVTAREEQELHRREDVYRQGLAPLEAAGRTVILVDDGLATGSTMKAAIAAVRQREPASVVVAVPTSARPTAAELRQEADDVVTVITPEPFLAVGHSYLDFSETSDEEVRRLLTTHRQPG